MNKDDVELLTVLVDSSLSTRLLFDLASSAWP